MSFASLKKVPKIKKIISAADEFLFNIRILYNIKIANNAKVELEFIESENPPEKSDLNKMIFWAIIRIDEII